jgi:hypothetical protein
VKTWINAHGTNSLYGLWTPPTLTSWSAADLAIARDGLDRIRKRETTELAICAADSEHPAKLT